MCHVYNNFIVQNQPLRQPSYKKSEIQPKTRSNTNTTTTTKKTLRRPRDTAWFRGYRFIATNAIWCVLLLLSFRILAASLNVLSVAMKVDLRTWGLPSPSPSTTEGHQGSPAGGASSRVSKRIKTQCDRWEQLPDPKEIPFNGAVNARTRFLPASQEASRPWKSGLVLGTLAISSHACKYEFCLLSRFGFFPPLSDICVEMAA